MKKMILVLAVLSSGVAQAKGGSDIGSGFIVPVKASNLSQKCRSGMVKANEQRLLVEKGIQTGEITPETSEFFLKSVNEMVGSAALTCVGLRNIELENSFSARIGLLSQERADELSADAYEEAIAFYESLNTK